MKKRLAIEIRLHKSTRKNLPWTNRTHICQMHRASEACPPPTLSLPLPLDRRTNYTTWTDYVGETFLLKLRRFILLLPVISPYLLKQAKLLADSWGTLIRMGLNSGAQTWSEMDHKLMSMYTSHLQRVCGSSFSQTHKLWNAEVCDNQFKVDQWP